MVDVFRAPQYAPAVVEEALALKPRPRVIWMQLGIRHDAAAKLADAASSRWVISGSTRRVIRRDATPSVAGVSSAVATDVTRSTNSPASSHSFRGR